MFSWPLFFSLLLAQTNALSLTGSVFDPGAKPAENVRVQLEQLAEQKRWETLTQPDICTPTVGTPRSMQHKIMVFLKCNTAIHTMDLPRKMIFRRILIDRPGTITGIFAHRSYPFSLRLAKLRSTMGQSQMSNDHKKLNKGACGCRHKPLFPPHSKPPNRLQDFGLHTKLKRKLTSKLNIPL